MSTDAELNLTARYENPQRLREATHSLLPSPLEGIRRYNALPESKHLRVVYINRDVDPVMVGLTERLHIPEPHRSTSALAFFGRIACFQSRTWSRKRSVELENSG